MWLTLVIGALGGYALVRIFAGYPAPAARHRRLARREAAFLAAAADAIYPRGGPIPPSGSDAGVPAYVDDYVDAVPPRVRLLMRLLFFLVEHATLVFPGPPPSGWRRFSSLSEEQRVAVLEDWRTSRLFLRRLVFNSLRAVLTMGYFGDPEVLRGMRLAPYAIDTPVCEADLLYPPAGRGKSEIRYGPADLTLPSDGTPLDLDGPLHPDYAEGRP